MNKELMLAVLAMDAYNTRGNVGIAVNLNIVISPEMLTSGFSAQAYTYNNETIISYRRKKGDASLFYLEPLGLQHQFD